MKMNATSGTSYAAATSGIAVKKSRKTSAAEVCLQNLLALADIRINGSRPWDIQIHNDRFYSRVLSEGTLGMGESYMDGWWDCDALDEMCCRAIRAELEERISLNFQTLVSMAESLVFNLQSRQRSHRVAEQHYDLGNDFFEAMLDSAMQYSCAYFRNTSDLAEAQRSKMDLICRKLALQPGMRLLDIGCGWGGLAKHAAQQWGCHVVGITISREQCAYATSSCDGLPIEIRWQDYRDLTESFDRVVSVGMLEHVGYKNYRTYLETVCRCVKESGLFLCQAIGGTKSTTHADPWVTRYIFPNSMPPSASQVAQAADGLFVLEDVHNFGADYDRTLLAWEKNFQASWHHFSNRYGERFYRMWRFYLLSCAGAFRARSIQLFQFLFSRGGIPGGCIPER